MFLDLGCWSTIFNNYFNINKMQAANDWVAFYLFISEYTNIRSDNINGQMKGKVFLKCCHLLEDAFQIKGLTWVTIYHLLEVLWCYYFKLGLKFCFLFLSEYSPLVLKTQLNLALMAASDALSTPMILNSHCHNNACGQPQHFTAKKPPWHGQFIIHFTVSHCSQ